MGNYRGISSRNIERKCLNPINSFRLSTKPLEYFHPSIFLKCRVFLSTLINLVQTLLPIFSISSHLPISKILFLAIFIRSSSESSEILHFIMLIISKAFHLSSSSPECILFCLSLRKQLTLSRVISDV